MPSNADEAFSRAFEASLALLLGRVRDLRSRALVVIDGRSGSGKTSLAAELAARWPRDEDVRVIELDDLYPGWDGLADAGRVVADRIMTPIAAGAAGTYEPWDWQADRSLTPVVVEPDTALIIEGSGALTPEAAGLADLTVWVDAPEASRKARALARDGDSYAPHWERWAAQERSHVARHRPAEVADLVIELP